MKAQSKMQQRLNNKARRPLGTVPKHSPSNFNAADARRSLKAHLDVEIEDPRMVFVPSERNVIYMSRAKVEQYKFKPEDILISISDHGRHPPALEHTPKEMLALNFAVFVTREEVEQGIHRFRPEDGDAIAQFLKRNTESSNVIVHCNAGEIRSRAVATSIADFFNLKAYTYGSQDKLERMFSSSGRDESFIGFTLYRKLGEHFD